MAPARLLLLLVAAGLLACGAAASSVSSVSRSSSLQNAASVPLHEVSGVVVSPGQVKVALYLADGRELRAFPAADGTFSFLVPPGSHLLQVVSIKLFYPEVGLTGAHSCAHACMHMHACLRVYRRHRHPERAHNTHTSEACMHYTRKSLCAPQRTGPLGREPKGRPCARGRDGRAAGHCEFCCVRGVRACVPACTESLACSQLNPSCCWCPRRSPSPCRWCSGRSGSSTTLRCEGRLSVQHPPLLP